MVKHVALTARTSNLRLIGNAGEVTEDGFERGSTQAVANDGPISVAQLSSRFTEFELGLKKLQRINQEMKVRLARAGVKVPAE